MAERSSVRTRVRAADTWAQPAWIALKTSADAALTAGPFSVMDKSVVPPSGDKHDYMTQAPYWWPDPKKPDGLPYIRRDGERNPELDRLPDHTAMDRMASAVTTLALAAYLGNDVHALVGANDAEPGSQCVGRSTEDTGRDRHACTISLPRRHPVSRARTPISPSAYGVPWPAPRPPPAPLAAHYA